MSQDDISRVKDDISTLKRAIGRYSLYGRKETTALVGLFLLGIGIEAKHSARVPAGVGTVRALDVIAMGNSTQQGGLLCEGQMEPFAEEGAGSTPIDRFGLDRAFGKEVVGVNGRRAT